MACVRVADRLADPQGEQSLVAGVGQGVDRLGEHASWSSVDPGQELEEEIQPIAEEKQRDNQASVGKTVKFVWRLKFNWITTSLFHSSVCKIF